MDLFKAIRERRSIRKYKDEPIDDSAIEKILDAARWAPNAGNYNSWRFVVITSPAKMKLLLQFCPGIDDVPAAIIVVCAKPKQKRLKDATRLMYMADCAIATQNIVLAAYSLNIGSCVVISFADKALREILNIPEDVQPYLLVTLGYASEVPEPPARLPISKIAFRNDYTKEWNT
jgi:nitroreductase